MLSTIIFLCLTIIAGTFFIKGHVLIALEPYWLVRISYSDFAIVLCVSILSIIVLYKALNFIIFGPIKFYRNYKNIQIEKAQNESINHYIQYQSGLKDEVMQYAKYEKTLSNNVYYWLLAIQFEDSKIKEKAIAMLKKYTYGDLFYLQDIIPKMIDNHQYEQAINILDQHTKELGTFPWLWEQKTICYIKLNEFKTAEKSYKVYKNLHHSNIDLESQIYLQQALNVDNAESKLKNLNTAYQINKTDEQITYIYAQSLFEARKNEQAINIINEYWQTNPTMKLANLLEQILDDATYDTDKFQIIKNITRKNENHVLSKLLLAKIALKANLWFIARDCLMNLAMERPDFAFPLLAQLEIQEKHDKEAAYKWLEKTAEYVMKHECK